MEDYLGDDDSPNIFFKTVTLLYYSTTMPPNNVNTWSNWLMRWLDKILRAFI
jgi:hypothetical protein